MKLQKLSTLRFNQQENEWIPSNQLHNTQPNFSFISEGLRVATYNILFGDFNNKLVNLVIKSRVRFQYQVKQLFPQINADILCLNEVRSNYFPFILTDPLVQQTYFISDTQRKCYLGDRQGNLILSKIPFVTYAFDQYEKLRCTVGLFILDKTNHLQSFLVISLHPIAQEKNFYVRKQQLQIIMDLLNNYDDKSDENYSYFRSAIVNKNIILLGDLNFHLKIETQFLYDHGLCDLWLETHQEEGYTWDSEENSMIGTFLIFENRRMRLDRIAIGIGNNLFSIKDKVQIFGNTKIFPNNKLSWLYPSDHWGLSVSLKVNQESNILFKPIISLDLDEEDQKLYQTGFRTMQQIICYRILLGLVIFSILVLYIII